MPELKTIAVLGAGGTMGFPMAENLAKAGFQVRAWNRSEKKAQPLTDSGAEVLSTPGEALKGADILLTMLAEADPVLEAAGEALEAAGEALEGGAEHRPVWLQMSTIGEEGTERCQKLAGERDLPFVDAPVLGTKEPAQQGKLVVLASGPSELKEPLKKVFDAVAQRSMWVGEAGAGTRLKLATNAWILAVVEGSAETLALAEGLGLDPQLVLEAIEGGPLDLPYLRMKGKAMIQRDFKPSFKLALAAKDAALVEESAGRHDLDLPLLQTVRRRLDEAKEQHGDQDLSATFLSSAPNRR